jgi:hypothetical protein
MAENQSWSIDDLRLNFQFGCEAAWKITRGKRAGMLRNPIYTGSTPAFWGSCDAVGGPAAWRIWGLASCGKGDPVQSMGVAHGCRRPASATSAWSILMSTSRAPPSAALPPAPTTQRPIAPRYPSSPGSPVTSPGRQHH